MRNIPFDPDPNSASRTEIHQRRRAQRAEVEAERLRDEVARQREEADDMRRALTTYLSGPEHHYDLLRGAETLITEAIRQMAARHKTCHACGGFSRAALDDLLGPALRALRDDLGLPDPDDLDERAGPWPVQPGQGYYAGRVMQPYQRTSNKTAAPAQTWRPPHWHS